ncbi:flagellar biosynthesis protein FlhA [Fluviispira sanaruensis]|uniref:Flagellar biosynthesis protein FlhA n=1 Tax=Fluviispira sanaruensis TaxID=2493639 RepID=A0A4P2VHV7_FLUSA|nr:flagellar biosynthesis protein FlhA [Fluviispira sanaruensis]BBH51928.1 flagellar biosynthesis protein FlhA [Fluviispira sanaruensis]
MAKSSTQVATNSPTSSLTAQAMTKNPDLIMAVVVVGTVLMMIFPLPVFFLDFLLAISISVALIILLVSIYITKPLEFGVFPTLLLISTLFRLSLNVATTRNILLHGADGEVANLVVGFGKVVVGGNFVVGFVIFIILMVINFIVITKGAGRVAEVAARFTLDAMPGKQMAIDAELNAGHINADEAKKRRKSVEKEADFYGAMDGASKFVRGDAIAGIIITVVNIIVGFSIGVLMHDLTPQDSAARFTLFAVGDGLISAIPALMISTAAGIIVTRATSEGNLGSEVLNQIRIHPKAFYIAAGLIFCLALIPGFPKLSFFILGSILVIFGRMSHNWIDNKKKTEESMKDADERKKDEKDVNNLDSIMKIDMLAIEVGHGLVPLIDPAQDGEVVDRIQGIRKQFAQEMGIIIPQVQLRDNLQLDPGSYQILLKSNKISQGNLMVDYFLAMDPGGVDLPISGETTKDPVYGLPAIWVHKRDKDEAVFRGYTVVNCSTVIATHVTKVLKEHAAELITRQDMQYLIDKLKESNPKVVDEVLQSDRLSLGEIVKVVQNLLREDVSVRDILTLFECLADHCRIIKNPDVLSEQCRKSFGRNIVQKLLNEKEEVLVVTFDRLIEDILSGGLVTTENGTSYINLDAKNAQEILQKLMKSIAAFEREGSQPVLLISAKMRQAFQRLVSRYIPHLVVLSYDEIPGDVNIKNLEMII